MKGREQQIEEMIDKINEILDVIDEKYYDDESFVPVVDLLESTKEELEEIFDGQYDQRDYNEEY